MRRISNIWEEGQGETLHMGQIITFAQQKGGAGKTTVLAHLAIAWLAEGRSVALVDLDPQKSLTRWATLRRDPGLALIESRDYRAASDLRSAQRSHDLVLVDCPGAASTLLDAALRESALVVAPCQPSALDAWAVGSVCDAAERQRTPIRILLNRIPPRTSSIAEVLTALGPRRGLLLDSCLGNRVAFSQALLSGRVAAELARTSTAAEEVAALRAEIDGLLAEALAA
jgi:chromosome partitioning protein